MAIIYRTQKNGQNPFICPWFAEHLSLSLHYSRHARSMVGAGKCQHVSVKPVQFGQADPVFPAVSPAPTFTSPRPAY
jgi:hypothetical protein